MGIPAAMCLGFAHHLNGKQIKGKTKPRKININYYINFFIT